MFPVLTRSTGERAHVPRATAGTMDRVLRPEIYKAAVASHKPKEQQYNELKMMVRLKGTKSVFKK